MSYAALWCKSNFSFLRGASFPHELFAKAKEYGIPAIAVTDTNGLYGIVQALQASDETGVRLIVGCELTTADGLRWVLLVRNRIGYTHLCTLISKAQAPYPKGECKLQYHDLCTYTEGLSILCGGTGSALETLDPHSHILKRIQDAFQENLWFMLNLQYRSCDPQLAHNTYKAARQFAVPIVACNEVLYHDPMRQPLQDTVEAIRLRTQVSELGADAQGNDSFALQSPASFAQRYHNDPAAVHNTRILAEQCTFDLRELRYQYPTDDIPKGYTATEWLRQIVYEGANQRWYGSIPHAAQKLIEHELGIIKELQYEGYFLTMYEIVQFCKQEKILCQGRGSAANSIVCYSLGITAIDPVRMDLLFERFLSTNRAEPPDIDLDIEHKRREEVIQHVYKKYGRNRAAMVANIVRYRSRSAIREVGKALGLDAALIDRVAKNIDRRSAHTAEEREAEWFDELGLDRQSYTIHLWLHLSEEILKFPRHLSIHSGGFVLGRTPLHTLVPQEPASMENRTVIQWDKDDLEEMGLFKVDLLGLGALTMMRIGFDLLQRHHNIHHTLTSVPHRDKDTFAMICAADTVGTFQIESRAQMSMLPRLRPQHFYDLVIEVSIVRPGPITGGMVHPYLKRRRGEEPVEYPHPDLKPVLEKTLGIPLFQEQVMKLAMVAADYDPGEADQLRRDMAAWKKTGKLERHKERLISRMLAKGITEEFAERVFSQIKGFADYGFPESHAASFALIAYATCWLKCHHPDVFLCAILNAQPLGFYRVSTLIEDAKRHSVVCRAADVQHSDWDTILEEPIHVKAVPRLHPSQAHTPHQSAQWAVRLGVRTIKGVHREVWAELARLREQSPFVSLLNLIERSHIDVGSLTKLARAGALDSLGAQSSLNRRQILWIVQSAGDLRSIQSHLFHHDRSFTHATQHLPELEANEKIAWEYTQSRHSVKGHPLAHWREALKAQGMPTAAQIAHLPSGQKIHCTGLAICRQRPGTANGVLFITLEDETGFINLICWPDVHKKYKRIIRSRGLLAVSGTVQNEDSICHVIVDAVWLPEQHNDTIAIPSRDFR